MALSKSNLQRKRQKKQLKRKAKKIAQLKTMMNPKSWAIYDTRMYKGIWDQGIGQVVIARKNDVNINVGVFLIDVYCLGVKNCFIYKTNISDYENILSNLYQSQGDSELVQPSYAATLIHKVIQYATNIGIKPHSDFAKARKMLNGIDIDNDLTFNFGKDGVPFYVQGPLESMEDANNILNTLKEKVGEGNFEFMISFLESENFA